METTKTEHWNQSNNEIPVFKVDPILVLILGLLPAVVPYLLEYQSC
jgi:hypothetical protein